MNRIQEILRTNGVYNFVSRNSKSYESSPKISKKYPYLNLGRTENLNRYNPFNEYQYNVAQEVLDEIKELARRKVKAMIRGSKRYDPVHPITAYQELIKYFTERVWFHFDRDPRRSRAAAQELGG